MDSMLELFKNKQLDNIPENKRLKENDFKRIIKYTDNCIFGNECSLWKGYITNNKSKYINFYFNGSKIALHRLLYLNFIGHLHENVYLSYTCCNDGVCCNVNHIIIKKKAIKKKVEIKKNTVEFNL
jgi:hypothetical protein